MSYETAREALEGRFETLWEASAYAAFKVGYSEHTFSFVPNTTSVRLKIADGEAQQKTMGDPGNNLVRYVGMLFIQIAMPGGAGSTAVRPIEDTILGFYRNQTFGGVRCRIPYVMSRDEDTPFLISTIAVPFERDEYHG